MPDNQDQPFDLGSALARIGNIPTQDMETNLHQAAQDEGAAYRGRLAEEQPRAPETPSFGYGMVEPITQPKAQPQPSYDYSAANLESGRNLSRQSFVDSYNKQEAAEPWVDTLNAFASAISGRPVSPYNANPSNYRQLTPSEEAEKYRSEQSEYAGLAAGIATPEFASATGLARFAPGPDQLNMFLPARAQQVSAAEKLEQQNFHPDNILKQTGAFRDVDGRWMREISDANSRVTPEAQQFIKDYQSAAGPATDIFEHPELYKQAPGLKKYQMELEQEPEFITSAHPDYFTGFQQKAEAMEQRGYSPKEIFKQSNMVRTPKGEWTQRYFPLGWHSGEEKNIRVAGANPEDFRKVILHESSHAVDKAMGRPSYGASDDRIYQDIAKLPKEEVIARAQASHAAGSPWAPNLDNYKDNWEGFLRQQASDEYMRNAAEARARNVETRRNMSPSELLNTHPFKTMDVPTEQQIVGYNPDGAPGRSKPVGDNTPSPNNTFTTAKGSVYQVHEDGTTTRTKALRNEPGHEGDQGVKPRSGKTIYVDDDGYNALRTHDTPLVTKGDQAARIGIGEHEGQVAPGSVAKFYNEPAVGLTPVEVWKKEGGAQSIHFGNPIVSVSPQTSPGIRVYHGSPHDYAAERLIQHPSGETEYIVGSPGQLPDVPQGAKVLQDFPLGRVRLDKVGTGEGAQAYGHGYYGAEREPVAQMYKEQLAVPTVEGKPFDTQDPRHIAASLLTDAKGDRADALARLRTDYNLAEHYDPKYKQLLELAKPILERGEILPPVKLKGHMYEANIAADPEHFLDYDKPIRDQSHTVKAALVNRFSPEQLEAAYRHFAENGINNPTGANLEAALSARDATGRPDRTVAAKVLNEAGIPGVKYLDQGSRAAGEGSRNFVVFDDKLISIVRKYGIPGAISMGLITAEQGRQMQEQGMANGGSISDGTRALLAKIKRQDGGQVPLDTEEPLYDPNPIPSHYSIPKERLQPDDPNLGSFRAIGSSFTYTVPPDASESNNVEDRRYTHPSLPTSDFGNYSGPTLAGYQARPTVAPPTSAAGVQGMAGTPSGPPATRATREPWSTTNITPMPTLPERKIPPFKTLVQPSMLRNFDSYAPQFGSGRAPFEPLMQPSLARGGTVSRPSLRNGGSIADRTRQLLAKLKNRA